MRTQSNIHISCSCTDYGNRRFVDSLFYLLAIFPDMLKSSEPMAQVIDDTNKGTIKHLSILWMEKNERKKKKNKIHLE